MAGFGIDIGIGAGGGFQSGASVAQANGPGLAFSTVAQPNDQIALYALSIVDPQSEQIIYGYTFPLSPESLHKEPVSAANTFDVGGPSKTLGVNRVADLYGLTPPTFRIEGSTGWQRHSTDGFAFTGLQSIAAIQNLLEQFAYLNAQQQEANNPDLYVMEFYDYFSNDFWQVIPFGSQIVRITNQRPLMYMYSFNFAGIKPVSNPPPPDQFDPILNEILLGGTQAIAQTGTYFSFSLSLYTGNTPGGAGIGI